MVLDHIVEQLNCCDRTGEMIVKIDVETLTARRFLFAHMQSIAPGDR